jgi:hypothetical protein
MAPERPKQQDGRQNCHHKQYEPKHQPTDNQVAAWQDTPVSPPLRIRNTSDADGSCVSIPVLTENRKGAAGEQAAFAT